MTTPNLTVAKALSDIDKAIQQNSVVFIKFINPTDEVCKTMQPIFAAAVAEFGRVHFVTVDIVKISGAVKRFKVGKALPACRVFIDSRLESKYNIDGDDVDKLMEAMDELDKLSKRKPVKTVVANISSIVPSVVEDDGSDDSYNDDPPQHDDDDINFTIENLKELERASKLAPSREGSSMAAAAADDN